MKTLGKVLLWAAMAIALCALGVGVTVVHYKLTGRLPGG